MHLDLAKLGTVITLVQQKELWILSFPPGLAYASGKERNYVYAELMTRAEELCRYQFFEEN